jgi:hypothetical protein
MEVRRCVLIVEVIDVLNSKICALRTSDAVGRPRELGYLVLKQFVEALHVPFARDNDKAWNWTCEVLMRVEVGCF